MMKNKTVGRTVHSAPSSPFRAPFTRHFLLCFSFLLACHFSALAQEKTKTASGKVVDESGMPIPGVRVTFEKEGQGSPTIDPRYVTLTSAEGDYFIKVDESGRLTFTFIGMQTEVVPTAVGNIFNVTMKPDVENIDEVVVTGIFTRKTESYTGASNTVTAADLQNFGNRDVLSTIRNVDPSFNVLENNLAGSDPNVMPNVQIRGNSSIPNVSDLKDEASASLNTPLVILDGFESNMNALRDMNENDIESITILKDASATAIYGSRGANGVVVITTKQPQSGRMRITWRSDLNIEAPDLTEYNLLNAREKLELERKVGKYDSDNVETSLKLKEYYNAILADVNRGVDTYWLSKPLRVGVGQKHSLRLEGGEKGFRYATSLQYNQVKGVMKGSDRNTFNGDIKLIYNLKKVKLQNNTIIRVNHADQSPYGKFSDYVKQNPYWTTHDEQGNLRKKLGEQEGVTAYHRWNKLPTNPLYNATLNTFDKTEETTIINNTSAEWTISKELLFRAQLGISKVSGNSDEFKPAEHTDFADYTEDKFFQRGSYTYGSSAGMNYDASANLSYNKLFKNKHFLFAGINYSMQQKTNRVYGFKAVGFANEDIDFLGAALQYEEDASPSASESVKRLISLASNINYMYDDRYLADFTFSMDGSSTSGANKRFAPFWSAGLGWNIHQEKWMKLALINRLKLRGSVGTSGSQEFSSYQALSTYQYYTEDRYYNWNGVQLMSLGNPDLRWQQEFNQNLGMDVELWKGRLQASFDWYNSRTDGMISSVQLAASNGFPSYVANIGEVTNKGYEFNLTGYLIRNYEKGISWSLGVSGIHEVNKLTKLSDALKDAQKELEENEDYRIDPNRLYREGYAMNTLWVVQSLGIDPSTGKEVYQKKNGEKTYLWNSDDLIDAGSQTPKLQGNINSTFRYKNLSLALSMGYRLGEKSYNSTLINKVENADFNYNVDQRVYDDRWQKPGDMAAFKGLNSKFTSYKSTRFVQTRNVLSLQNINIRYDLKPIIKILNDSRFENFMITANASNLFYLSNVKEERGISYPFARNFSLGLNLIF